MKKISLLLLGVLLSFGMANAQSEPIAKGTYVLNPQVLNLGFQSISVKDADDGITQFGLGFGGGYAVMDNLLINGQLSFQHLNLKPMDAKFTLLAIGAGARYYFPGNFFGGVGLMMTDVKVKSDGDDVDTGTNFVELRADLGYAYYLTPNMALEPFISYGSKIAGGDIDDMGDFSYSRFSLNLGVSIFF
ncbi:MAG: outer membrane beta-barrel protein [Bacteroidales bacterium]